MKFKLSEFLKNLVMTTATSLIVIVSMILIMRFLAKGLGPQEFGAYTLARRIISNIIPLAFLSVDVALVRYIAMAKDDLARRSYVASSLLLGGTALICLSIVTIVARKPFSYLMFHRHDYLNLYDASLFLLIGYSLFALTYAYWGGFRSFRSQTLASSVPWPFCR